MPDIELRLGRDVLVLSAPLDTALERQGVDVARDRQYLNLMEPDAVADAMRMELVAGAQCLVTTTEDITRARLSHVRMEQDSEKLAQAAARIVNDLKPQHTLVEIGPTGLPLDASSKASLNESRSQYADAARAFDGCEFDAFFLNGFASIPDLKCALMGVAQVSGKPVFASVALGAVPNAADSGSEHSRAVADATTDAGATAGATSTRGDNTTLFDLGYEPVDGPISPAVPAITARMAPELWPEALAAMVDLGASVVGFETAQPLDKAVAYVEEAVAAAGLPVLAQLRVTEQLSKALKLVPITERTDYSIDTMEHAAMKLHAAGAQFLRATGAATPAFTGALAATVSGLSVR